VKIITRGDGLFDLILEREKGDACNSQASEDGHN
jgi:hypothetical protein